MSSAAVAISPISLMFVSIGGVTASGSDAESALSVLRTWRTTTVQVPLRRARNPLGWCDYRAVAEPFRGKVAIPMMGRGANGRPLTKLAFCLALEDVISQIWSVAPFTGLVLDAARAFLSDSAYSVSIARSAVAIMESRHRAALRDRLVASSQLASRVCEDHPARFSCTLDQACGTGDCPFADKSLAFLRAPAQKGRVQRPSRHVSRSYDLAAALAGLEEAEPFELPVPGRARTMAAA